MSQHWRFCDFCLGRCESCVAGVGPVPPFPRPEELVKRGQNGGQVWHKLGIVVDLPQEGAEFTDWSRTACTLPFVVWTPSLERLWPKYSTESWKKRHFSRLRRTPW